MTKSTVSNSFKRHVCGVLVAASNVVDTLTRKNSEQQTSHVPIVELDAASVAKERVLRELGESVRETLNGFTDEQLLRLIKP